MFAEHQGVIKTYLTITNKFFIPNLVHYLRSYIKECHICQLACNEKPPKRQPQNRIDPNYIPLSRLSMDLKVMPRSYRGHKFILCITDIVTNYLTLSLLPNIFIEPSPSTASFCLMTDIVLIPILQKLAVPRVCNSSHDYVLLY